MKIQGQQLQAVENPLAATDESQRAIVQNHLERILNSRAFGNSNRAKQFLSYVVEHALQGQTDALKERTIGVELFHRRPTYQTGDDPIVRVKAAEVRRRLAQYYAEEERAPKVRIKIPVGSYIPEFHWDLPSSNSTKPSGNSPRAPKIFPVLKAGTWISVIAIVIVTTLVMMLLRTTSKQPPQPSYLNEFWGPLFATEQPVLICLASPVVYTPSFHLYSEANRVHPGLYDSPVKQFNTLLRLDPNTSITWRDMEPHSDTYVNKDDAYVAADLSKLFAVIHKPSQLRAGRDFSYDDIRNSPAVLIGAFNNRWTMRMTAELPFVFREQNDIEWIQDRGKQSQVWRPEPDARGTKDYAIVARLLNSKTGQFLVIVAGIGMVGTQAAGAFVSREDFLHAGLEKVPRNWKQKSLEMVLECDVIDGSAAAPRVLAAKAW